MLALGLAPLLIDSAANKPCSICELYP